MFEMVGCINILKSIIDRHFCHFFQLLLVGMFSLQPPTGLHDVLLYRAKEAVVKHAVLKIKKTIEIYSKYKKAKIITRNFDNDAEKQNKRKSLAVECRDKHGV